jgi:hypothetical protein
MALWGRRGRLVWMVRQARRVLLARRGLPGLMAPWARKVPRVSPARMGRTVRLGRKARPVRKALPVLMVSWARRGPRALMELLARKGLLVLQVPTARWVRRVPRASPA